MTPDHVRMAADWLKEFADEWKNAETIDGRWPKGTESMRDSHAEVASLVPKLRLLAKLLKRNADPVFQRQLEVI